VVLTAHQPVYLPWLGLFHKIALADVFVSFDRVQYQPKDFNNRNRVRTAAGPAWLSVPVHKKGHRDKPYDEIEIDERTPWRRKHWRTLEMSYGKAPHWLDYRDFFAEVYDREWTHLAELNDHMLQWFLTTLGIELEFRFAHDLDLEGEKSGLVLDMCRKLGADRFIFGALGRDYADVTAFTEAGIEVAFQDYRHPVYPQIHGGFEPYMSIVDLLFNCGDAAFEILMSGQVEPVA
jgi:hypothetical protein